MDIAYLQKAFALIAKGLIEKDETLQQEPQKYPYSSILQHGINRFLAAGDAMGCPQYSDENAFLSAFLTKPIANWFDACNKEMIAYLKLEDTAFFSLRCVCIAKRGKCIYPQ